MNLRELIAQSPLIVSVQASEGAAVDTPATLAQMAQASAREGIRLLRAQGRANIEAIRAGTGLPTIGLIKQSHPASEVYITPTAQEVSTLLGLGCEIIALDGTARPRPGGETLADLVSQIHAGGSLAMADCDTIESVRFALAAGADAIGTTLAGYTRESIATPGPDFHFLRTAIQIAPLVIAEGRFSRPEEAQAAIRMGATGVVIGGAINDPVKQTRAFSAAVRPVTGPVGAVDIGGTRLRFALFSPAWELLVRREIPLPSTAAERETWILDQIAEGSPSALGVSTGGVVSFDGTVVEAKPIIPDHVGSQFTARRYGLPVYALNDGLATAWGHACRAEFAGRRVATLALGTGLGCGLVHGHQLFTRGGDYPRLNDLPAAGGDSFEDLLGGAALSANPNPEQKARAIEAAHRAYAHIEALWMPDEVVWAGGIGLAPWLQDAIPGGVPSPFGMDAGLYGAAALALFPPRLA